MSFAVQPGQRVLFMGDSITDHGRREGSFAPLGNGYARMAVDLIRAKYPEDDREYFNRGIGGNTVRSLFDRWTDDCIRLRPDWLSMLIGINDISGHLSGGAFNVGPEEYESLYRTLLEHVRKETKARLLLISPFFVSTVARDAKHGWRGRVQEILPKYIQVVEKMAKEHKARYLNAHEVFQKHLAHQDPEALGDTVHLTLSGNLILAYEWLKTMGW